METEPARAGTGPTRPGGVEWRDVPGFVGLYEVPSAGQIRSVARLRRDGRRLRERILKPIPHPTQLYFRVSLHRSDSAGKVQTIKVHRAVASAFLPNPEGKSQVNHINLCRTDNRVENLEWTTAAENNAHRRDAGPVDYAAGERNGRARLTPEHVAEIRQRHTEGEGHRALARAFGLDHKTVGRVIHRTSWKEV